MTTGFPLRVDRHTHWRLVAPDWAEKAIDASHLIDRPDAIAPPDLLKSKTRRLVFALGTVIVKAFPLEHLRHRLRHRKYAPSEAQNLRLAAQRSIPVPEVYGVGASTRFGLVRWNAVLMERIDGVPLDRALQMATDRHAREALLARTLPVFRALFRAGCNHIDVRPSAFIVGTAPAVHVIDFQYCTFLDQPSADTFAAQAGWFLHALERELASPDAGELADQFAVALLDVLEPAAERPRASEILSKNRSLPASIAQRLKQ